MSNQFDDMKLDDHALEDIANFIIIYCSRQRQIIHDYMQKMNSLTQEWDDDVTMGSMLREVQMLTNNIERIMDIICFKYPQYFKAKAAELRARPSHQNY